MATARSGPGRGAAVENDISRHAPGTPAAGSPEPGGGRSQHAAGRAWPCGTQQPPPAHAPPALGPARCPPPFHGSPLTRGFLCPSCRLHSRGPPSLSFPGSQTSTPSPPFPCSSCRPGHAWQPPPHHRPAPARPPHAVKTADCHCWCPLLLCWPHSLHPPQLDSAHIQRGCPHQHPHSLTWGPSSPSPQLPPFRNMEQPPPSTCPLHTP